MFIRALTVVAAGYLLGNLNGAVLLSRLLAHDDVRRHGSGNAGFTNFCRNYGGLTGLLVFLIDAAKASLAVWLGQYLFAPLGLGLEGAALASVAPAEGLYKRRDVFFLCAEFRKIPGHTDGDEELLQLFDAFTGGGFRVGKVHLAAPDPDRDLGKAHDVVFHHIGEHRRHRHRQPRAVGAVIQGG